jgi:hypothetical protein
MNWLEEVVLMETARHYDDELIEFGESVGCTFKKIPMYRGVVTEAFADETFVYRDVGEMPDTFKMPKEAHRRLALVGSHFAIKQIVIAEEIKSNEIDWRHVAEVVGRATIGVLQGLAVVAGALTVAVLSGDPKLIVILADDSWVSICEWL